MAASAEQELQRLVAELPRSRDPVSSLRAIKTIVLTLPLSSLKVMAPVVPLGGLFSLLDGDDGQSFVRTFDLLEDILPSLKKAVLTTVDSRNSLAYDGMNIVAVCAPYHGEQIGLCVSILERLLEALEPVFVAHNFKEELQRGLFHPNDAVKILTVAQVGRIVESSEAIAEIFNNLELLRQIILCIGGEKIAVAKEAIKALARIARSRAGLETLFVSSLLNDLKNVMTLSDIVRYRVYELIVEICSVSEDSLRYGIKSGFISQLLEELTGDDVLVRVTCIEMVTMLACTMHGRQYLAQQGVIDKISNMIISSESDPFSSFYLPGLVKFFGNLAVMDSPQQICEQYPAFVEKIFEMAEGHDVTMIGVAVDTVGILGSNIEGKQVLNKTDHVSAYLPLSQEAGERALRCRDDFWCSFLDENDVLNWQGL